VWQALCRSVPTVVSAWLPSNVSTMSTGSAGLGSIGLEADAPTYAGFWARGLAWFIDSLVLSIIGTAIQLISAPLLSALGGNLAGTSSAATLAFVVPLGTLTLCHWLYFAVQESSAAQATLGKRAVGIRVTDLDGRRISFWLATVRYFAKFISALILFLGYMMAAFTAHHQALHDMMVGTLVVRAR